MTCAAVTDKPWNYLGPRFLPLCGSSVFTFWPPGEIGWGSLGEFVLTRPGHSGKSFPSCSRHCNSVTGPCLAARELTNAGTCVLRKKGKLGYTVKACKREKSLHFPMSELQRPYRGGWDYVESFIFVSFPSRSGKVSLFKKKKDHEKKMTHNAKKKKWHICKEKNKAIGVVRGWGSHPGPTTENSSYPLHVSSSSLREGRPSAYCTGGYSDNGSRKGVLGAWHMGYTRASPSSCLQWQKAAPLSLQLLLHPCATLWEVDAGPFFNSLHGKSARSWKSSCLTRNLNRNLSHRCRKQTYGTKVGRRRREINWEIGIDIYTLLLLLLLSCFSHVRLCATP